MVLLLEDYATISIKQTAASVHLLRCLQFAYVAIIELSNHKRPCNKRDIHQSIHYRHYKETVVLEEALPSLIGDSTS